MSFLFRVSAMVTCLAWLCAATASADPMVVNGDFEGENTFTVWPGYTGNGNPEEIPGWTGSGNRGLNPIAAEHEAPAPFRDNGSNDTTVAFLQGTAAIEQVVTGFAPGTEYTLGLDFNARNCCGDFPVANILIDGEVVGSSLDLPFPGGGVIPVGGTEPWYHADIDFTPASDSITLRIESMSMNAADSTLIVDNIQIVPEPSAGFLTLLGLGILVFRRRRQ